MDWVSKFYINLIWALGYISTRSPSLLENSDLKFRLISVPGILNILHCTSMLFTFGSTIKLLMQTSVRDYYTPTTFMLVTMANAVDFVTAIVVRILSAKFTSQFLLAYRSLTEWRRGESWGKFQAIVWLTVTVVLGGTTASSIVSIFETGMVAVQNSDGGVLLALTVINSLFASTTHLTAIPFALTYIVVMGSNIVAGYVNICRSLEERRCTAAKMRELKGRFKLLKMQTKMFYRIANFYGVCIVVRCAVTLLEMVALVAIGINFGGLQTSIYSFIVSNILCLLILAHAGNRFETEVGKIWVPAAACTFEIGLCD